MNAPNLRGYTLVEVLLALVILGIAAVGLIGATGRALSVVSVSSHYALARELAERVRLEHPLERTAETLEGETAGDFGAAYPDWRWQREVEPLWENSGEPVFRVRLRLLTRDRGRQVSHEFVELQFVPPE